MVECLCRDRAAARLCRLLGEPPCWWALSSGGGNNWMYAVVYWAVTYLLGSDCGMQLPELSHMQLLRVRTMSTNETRRGHQLCSNWGCTEGGAFLGCAIFNRVSRRQPTATHYQAIIYKPSQPNMPSCEDNELRKRILTYTVRYCTAITYQYQQLHSLLKLLRSAQNSQLTSMDEPTRGTSF